MHRSEWKKVKIQSHDKLKEQPSRNLQINGLSLSFSLFRGMSHAFFDAKKVEWSKRERRSNSIITWKRKVFRNFSFCKTSTRERNRKRNVKVKWQSQMVESQIIEGEMAKIVSCIESGRQSWRILKAANDEIQRWREWKRVKATSAFSPRRT